MPKFKKSKWVGYRFTKTQKMARSKWTWAHEYEEGLIDSLHMSYETYRKMSHQDVLDRVEQMLDKIERIRAEAKADFPEVSESFSVGEMKL